MFFGILKVLKKILFICRFERQGRQENMMNIRTEAEAREAFAAFRELRVESLVTNHVLYSGCVEYGYPCLDHNGPCCCEPGCCPFGQEEVRLDEEFVKTQLTKLHLASDIARAEEHIRRAREIIQSWE